MFSDNINYIIIFYFTETVYIKNEDPLPIHMIVPVVVGIIFGILVLGIIITVLVKRKRKAVGSTNELVEQNSVYGDDIEGDNAEIVDENPYYDGMSDDPYNEVIDENPYYEESDVVGENHQH